MKLGATLYPATLSVAELRIVCSAALTQELTPEERNFWIHLLQNGDGKYPTEEITINFDSLDGRSALTHMTLASNFPVIVPKFSHL
jgi:hypothetical protein